MLIKWFHAEGEDEVTPSRAILDAHARGEIEAHIIDLAMYEVGNVLLRTLQWSATDVADQLDDLIQITGPPLSLASETLRDAAVLGHASQLSFYDACWAASARTLGVPLISADRRLIKSDMAESPTAFAQRYGL